MSLSPTDSAILQVGMAGEEIGQAAHAAYWLRSYQHEGAEHQLKMLREEFNKLADLMKVIGVAERDTGYLHLGKAGAAIAMAEDARKSEAAQ